MSRANTSAAYVTFCSAAVNGLLASTSYPVLIADPEKVKEILDLSSIIAGGMIERYEVWVQSDLGNFNI